MKGLILIFGLMILLFGCVGTPETGAPKETTAPTTTTEETIVDIPVGEAAEEAVEAQETEPEEPAPEPEPEPEPVAETSELDELEQKELKFDAKDGWDIYGTAYYTDTKQPTTLIILVPMLGADRTSYDDLIVPLHEEIPYADIVAIDARGHGESTNLGTYSNFQTGDFRAMKNDIDAVVTYFGAARPSINKYYLVGASAGSSACIDYAEGHDAVSKVVMISPGIEYQGFDITEDAEGYLHELYLMAGEDDSYSATSASTIYNICPSDTKEKKIYDGISAHGTNLFGATETYPDSAVDVIVKWIK